jgi:NAD dependent epimerase/dehydratase family enzyme
MKVVIPGGRGRSSSLVPASSVAATTRRAEPRRRSAHARALGWANPRPLTKELDGADAVIHLAGRSVNCRYTLANVGGDAALARRPTLLVGSATPLARARRVWLQMSTATLYAHRFDALNDEAHRPDRGR